MAKLPENEIVTLLRREIEEAQGYDSEALGDYRAKALDYYHGKMDAAAKGRSQLVSTDVRDVVHTVMAQASEIYKSSTIMFDPENEEDEKECQMESDVVKDIIEKNDEWQTFDMANFDALLQANGWIKVEPVIEETITPEQYENIMPEQLLLIMQPIKRDEQVTEVSRTVNEDGTFDVEIERYSVKQKVSIECVSPDRMLFSPASDQFKFQDLRFVAEIHYMTTAELTEAGLTDEQAKEVKTVTDTYYPAIVARQGIYSETTNNELGGKQTATELKETFICYIQLDEGENNEVTRYKIHLAGTHIIEKVEHPYIPYVTGSPIPMPHRIQGAGMYDSQKGIQDSKTSILRKYVDNLEVSNRSRLWYINGEVNEDELLEGRINGAVGVDRPDAIGALPSNNIGPEAIQGLQYLDQVRSSRGGASLDMTKGEMQVAQSSAYAAAREYDAKELMSGWYCKNLAHTLLKGTYLLIHRVLRDNWKGPIDAKIRGKWVQTVPAQWREREDARVTVGQTSGEKAARVQGLSTLVQMQQQWIAGGEDGIMTDRSKLYNTVKEWIDCASLGQNEEAYLIDPTSQEAQQRQQQNAQQAQQQQAQMQQMQQAMMQMQAAMEKMKDDTERWKTMVQTQQKYFDTMIGAEVKEAELTVEGMQRMNELDTEANAN